MLLRTLCGYTPPHFTLPQPLQPHLSDPTCSAVPCHTQPPDGDYGWGLLLRTLSDVLQHDRRPQLAEATLDVLFALLSEHSAHWDDAAWRVLLQRVLRHMLALPPGLVPGEGVADAGGVRGAGASLAGAAATAAQELQQAAVARAEEEGIVLALLRRMDRYFPLLCEQIGLISEKYQVRRAGGLVGCLGRCGSMCGQGGVIQGCWGSILVPGPLKCVLSEWSADVQ